MGLLDSVIGAMTGGQGGGLGGVQGGRQGGGLGGMLSGGGAQAALVTAVIGMLMNSSSHGQQGGAASGASGADGASGGGGGIGGLGDLIGRFTQGGMGDVIGSWIGHGQNAPVSGSQVTDVLGSDAIGKIAAQLGITHAEAADQVSQVLPQVVDQLTPQGQVPEGGLGSIGDILAQFSKR